MMTCYMTVVYIFYFDLAELKVGGIILFPLLFERVDFTGLVSSRISEPLILCGLQIGNEVI